MGRPLADNGERDYRPSDLPPPVPHFTDGDRLAKAIRNEIGRTFYATGGETITGDQAFAQIMARASAAKRGR